MSELGEHELVHVTGDLEIISRQEPASIVFLCNVSAEEANKKLRSLRDFSQAKILVELVRMNISDFVNTVKFHVQEYADNGNISEESITQARLDFIRKILNILSSFRTFLDHADCAISRKNGKLSNEYSKWKSAQSAQYDSSAAYRIVSRLRNYCQHVGVPPMQITFGSERLSGEITLQLLLERDSLLSERDIWNQKTRQDLEAFLPQFSIFELLASWEECFNMLSQHVLISARDVALPHAQTILSYRNTHNIPENVGKLAFMQTLVISDEKNKVNFKLNWLPEGGAQEILTLTENSAQFDPILQFS